MIVILTLIKFKSGLPRLETAAPKLTIPSNFTAAISDWIELPFVDIKLGFTYDCYPDYEFLFNRYWNGTVPAFYCDVLGGFHFNYDACPLTPYTIDAGAPLNQTRFHPN